jgi:hypothetical protein
MFKTVGNTFDLIRASWRVLEEDSRLILFPVMSAAAVLVFAVLVFGAFYASGTFDRYGEDGGATPLDLGIMFLAYLGVAFVVIYFNAALIACAFERLRGGSPNLRYGLRSSNRRIGSNWVGRSCPRQWG